MNATAKQKWTFWYRAPAAQEVLLAGDFTHWMKNPNPLDMKFDGVWRATTSLAPGTHQYRFVVDGAWRNDPECKVHAQNPFGTQNDVIQIGAATGGGECPVACLLGSKS